MFHPLGQPMERGWVGRIEGDRVVHLAGQTLQSFLTGGGREHAVYPLGAVRLLAPVLHPPAVRVFDDQTSFAFANPAAIVGPDSTIARRGPSNSLLQGVFTLFPRVAGVVGSQGKIAGYTLLAEWRTPGLPVPKDRDFAFGLGPVVVTADELDPDGLQAVVTVDGEERLRGSSESFDWAEAETLAGEATRLYPGDLLAGPPLGAVPVETGSSVEVEADGIGILEQSVSR